MLVQVCDAFDSDKPKDACTKEKLEVRWVMCCSFVASGASLSARRSVQLEELDRKLANMKRDAERENSNTNTARAVEVNDRELRMLASKTTDATKKVDVCKTARDDLMVKSRQRQADAAGAMEIHMKELEEWNDRVFTQRREAHGAQFAMQSSTVTEDATMAGDSTTDSPGEATEDELSQALTTEREMSNWVEGLTTALCKECKAKISYGGSE